jgi:hypothetical protein
MIGGCATPSLTPTVPLHTEYFPSRDGVLQYRLPSGWFDATTDSQAVGHAIWLLRDDYAVSLMVDEMHIDDAARQTLGPEGLLQLAQLNMPLMAGDKAAMIQESPHVFRINGKEFCSYVLITSTARDTLRVVLFDTGTRVYTVMVLVQGGQRGISEGDVASLQDGFLKTLRW